MPDAQSLFSNVGFVRMFIFPCQSCGQLRKGLTGMWAIIIGLDAGLALYHENLKDESCMRL